MTGMIVSPISALFLSQAGSALRMPAPAAGIDTLFAELLQALALPLQGGQGYPSALSPGGEARAQIPTAGKASQPQTVSSADAARAPAIFQGFGDHLHTFLPAIMSILGDYASSLQDSSIGSALNSGADEASSSEGDEGRQSEMASFAAAQALLMALATRSQTITPEADEAAAESDEDRPVGDDDSPLPVSPAELLSFIALAIQDSASPSPTANDAKPVALLAPPRPQASTPEPLMPANFDSLPPLELAAPGEPPLQPAPASQQAPDIASLQPPKQAADWKGLEAPKGAPNLEVTSARPGATNDEDGTPVFPAEGSSSLSRPSSEGWERVRSTRLFEVRAPGLTVEAGAEARRPAPALKQARPDPLDFDVRGMAARPANREDQSIAGPESQRLEVVADSSAQGFAPTATEPAPARENGARDGEDSFLVQAPPPAGAALPPAADRPAVRASAPDVVEQIARQAHLVVRRGKAGLSIQLNPPDLGKVQVHVSVGPDGVNVKLAADSGETRELLEASVQQLKSAFDEQGLTVRRLDVEPEFSFSGFTLSQDDSRRQQSASHAPTGESYTRRDEEAESDSPRSEGVASTLVDYRV